MFAALFTITLFVALVFADMSIDTPQFAQVSKVLCHVFFSEIFCTQCQPAEITWNGGNSPYNLIIVSADDVCGNSL